MFKNNVKEVHFLDARAKHLEKVTIPRNGHSEWNGNAVALLTGQGRLYILPGIEAVEDIQQQDVTNTQV